MTRVAGIGSGAAPARRAARAGGGFALPADIAAEAPTAAAAPGVGALFAMQEQAPVAPPGERARRRARVTLDELRGLQLDLLRGAANPVRLERLAALSEQAGVDDPALGAVLAEIGVRARVELARYRMTLRQRTTTPLGGSASGV